MDAGPGAFLNWRAITRRKHVPTVESSTFVQHDADILAAAKQCARHAVALAD
jgi:hypothetical protein